MNTASSNKQIEFLRTCLCVAIAFTKRLAQLTLFYPASIVALIALTLALAGQSPFEDIARFPIDYAEAQKLAPTGYVFETNIICADVPEQDARTKPDIRCSKKGGELISASDAVIATHIALLRIYSILLIFSAALLMPEAFHAPRQFFGLPHRRDESISQSDSKN
jgi:hypothetical protein